MTAISDNSIVNINKVLIEEQAQAWFVRVKSADISTAQQAEFDKWLAADSMHRMAYQELTTLWDLVGSFSEAPKVQTARADVLRNTSTKKTKYAIFGNPWSTLAIAASLMIVVITGLELGMGNLWDSPSQGDVYQTRVGESKSIGLADGSIVLLDTNTRLIADYSQHRRRISLERGQARFDVAHDQQRPFSVEAGEGVVTALGTTFVVRKTANDVLVTLIEGKVEVARQAQVMTLTHTPDEPKDLGRQLAYSKQGISKPDTVDIPQVTAWQQGRLVFNNHSLPEVIAELNRYSEKKIIIADRSLRGIKVTGVFNAGDSRNAIDALKTYFSMSLSTDQQGNFILTADPDMANISETETKSHL